MCACRLNFPSSCYIFKAVNWLIFLQWSLNLFSPLNRHSTSLGDVWETCESILCSSQKPPVRSDPKSFHMLFLHHFSREKETLPSLLTWFFIPSKAGLQNHCRSPSIGKDVPVGTCLKDKPFRNILHFSWVVATHSSSSFKKQNENIMITQAWKQMPHYYRCVLDTLTSAELRKSECNKGKNCKGNYCGLPTCSC